MLWIVVVLGIFIDQLSKVWVVNTLPFGQTIPVIGDFFSLRYIHNEGAAWSILNGRVGLLTILTVVITIVVLVVWHRTPKEKKWMRFAFALLVAGAVGNIIDRVRLGYVVDFLQLPNWPIFNIADCLLVVSVVMLCILVLLEGREERKQAKTDKQVPEK